MSIALTFILFLILFTVVGMYAATQQQDTTADYLLAGRNVNPWAIAKRGLRPIASLQLNLGVLMKHCLK